MDCKKCKNTMSIASKKTKLVCGHCKKEFCGINHFQSHQRSIPRKIKNQISDLNQEIYPETGYEKMGKYSSLILEKGNEIEDYVKSKPTYYIKNIKISSTFTYKMLYEVLIDIYINKKCSYKINLGFGFIL